MLDLVGKELANYRIDSVVGQGGMGVVFRAHDLTLDREVAIKVLQAPAVPGEDFSARFQREARILASLVHPNILPVFQYGQSEGLAYLVMPFINGGSLAGMLRGGPLQLTVATAIVTQLASALDAAHKLGIIHRDLKPGNVMISDAGQVYLADFGIARLMQQDSADASSRTMTGTVLGTPKYMAPEALQARELDARADIYSLGVLTFEMLSGALPFEGKTAFEVISAHLLQEWPRVDSLRPEVPLPMALAVQRALARDREERFATAGEFAAAFSSSDGQRTAIHAVCAPAPLARAPSKTRRLWVVMLAALVIAAGLVWWMQKPVRLMRLTSPLPVEHPPPAQPTDFWFVAIAVFASACALGLAAMAFRKWRATPPGIPAPVQPATAPAPEPRSETPPPSWDGPATVIEPAVRTSVLASDAAARVEARPAAPPPDATRLLQATPAAPGTGRRLPAVRLTFIHSADPLLVGKSVPVASVPFRIGRADAELCIAADAGLSRHHASIDWDGRAFRISDLGSRNGTYLDGRQLRTSGAATLLYGGVIRLGNSTVLTFSSDDLQELPDFTGQVIDGRYTLTRMLRNGTKTALYEAKDSRLPQLVAVKVLSPKLAEYPGYLDAFNREAETAARLRHPHICRVLDYGQSRLRAAGGETVTPNYISMELMEGGSLSARLQGDEPIPFEQAVALLDKVSDALDYAHREGVVHSGLKPSSVMFDRDGKPYVADFAMAWRPGDQAGRVFLGAPEFLAPEQWEGLEPTPRVDQYALAVIAYLMVAGVSPFEGQEDPKVRRRNLERGPAPAHEEALRRGRPPVPLRVSDVLRRALAVKPEDRYASVREFFLALQYAAANAAGPEAGKCRVFISYQRDSSSGWAVLFARELARKHDVIAFVDTERLDGAVRFPARLKSAIEDSDVFVCLLSATTLKSAWVQEEIRLACENHKPMVPVFQESFSLPDQSESLSPQAEALISFNGVHLLDRRNIHVDHTIEDLARIVKESASETRSHSAQAG